MMQKYFVVLTALILTSFFFSCGPKKQSKQDFSLSLDYEVGPVDTAGAVVGDWIIQRELADPQSLNPITLQDATGREFSLHVFERLLWATDRMTYEIHPWLAEALPEESPDHLTYTYKIKKNVTFSNGKPLTGEDVVFSFKAAMNPLVDAAQLRNSINMVSNVELVNGDKYTVRFTLSKPYFKAIYSISDMQIMSKEVADPEGLTDKYTFADCGDFNKAQKIDAMKKFADFFNSQDMVRNPKYLIGSGPYIFEKWDTGQWVYFKRNTNYWNRFIARGFVYPEKLILKVIPDQSAAVVAAKNKEIDLMYVVRPSDYVNELGNPEKFDMKKADPFEPAFSYIGYNMKNPLFSDVKVRWALAYVVDREAIIKNIHLGLAVPIQGPVYFGDKKNYNTELPYIPFDLEKAKQLLKEAGWTDSNGDGILDKDINGKRTDFKFIYLSNTNIARRQSLLVIVDALKKIGIQSDVQDIEWSVFLQKLKKHEFDAYMGSWILSDYPADEYQLYHSSQMENEGSNYTSYSNPEADKLMEAYRLEFDENRRSDILKKVQKIFYDDQNYTYLWTPKAKYVYGTRFRNVRWYPTSPTSYQTPEWWVPTGSRKFQSAN